MKIIIGLGNPGAEYQNTRHNAGFMLVDFIKEKFGFPDFVFHKKFNAEIAEGKIGEKKIILLKPQTFMNNSGEAVAKAVKFFKALPAEVMVAHDDKDIETGKYKIHAGHGAAGHHGVESIINRLNTKDFLRVRLGIAPKNNGPMADTADFVLKKMNKSEKEVLFAVISEAADKIFLTP